MEVARDGIAVHGIEFCKAAALGDDAASAPVIPAGDIAAGFGTGSDGEGERWHGERVADEARLARFLCGLEVVAEGESSRFIRRDGEWCQSMITECDGANSRGRGWSGRGRGFGCRRGVRGR